DVAVGVGDPGHDAVLPTDLGLELARLGVVGRDEVAAGLADQLLLPSTVAVAPLDPGRGDGHVGTGQHVAVDVGHDRLDPDRLALGHERAVAAETDVGPRRVDEHRGGRRPG